MNAQASHLEFVPQSVCPSPALLLARSTSVAVGVERTEGRRPMDRDDELLELITGGDEGAFRELVERHVDRAYALALRILRNGADAEDVVQDTLLKIWSHRGSWQSGRAKFSTWLYRVVTNRCLDMRRRPKTEGMDEAPEMVDAQPDALTTLQRHEASDLLAREMERLPDQQRVALILSYYDDLSNAQIAEVMDTTVQAVESLLKRGRQHLRRQLDGARADICRTFTGS
ncbi:MAG TPA: RNA polymerase sigma factor [Bosea sp. (in: a-proteobacteria)]|jgi:RNA polymerase sigma-70 factor (ECF subfamily)|uniref:RNA polymerase sigma factor n=1 Tax=Bosea sp. (in: a-proteobacteria) TaxID=1871050 RepID=UPI002DDD4B83|nr:RNA polymerase sigma factor [Bosea sp. (in: a-proteobacteria)]HEV2555699.1 RNA polymerase sigma factor [Bosea sp. (in: a-proteobacteria)]